MLHTLVFSGGANLATAFFGCVKFLEHAALTSHVHRYVGSSAGAFVALLLALRLSSASARSWTRRLVVQHDMHKISLDSVMRVCDTYGLDSGDRLDQALRATLQEFCNDPDITLRDMAKATGNVLVVCTLNVSTGRHEYLSVDSAPDLPVRKAVRMSMAVPLLFRPVRHDGCLYVDPVLGRNFPYDFLSGQADGHDRVATEHRGILGFSLETHTSDDGDDGAKHAREIDDLASFVSRLIRIAVDESNARERDCGFKVVGIDTGRSVALDPESLSFDWSDALVDELVQIGYVQTRDALTDFTPAGYTPPSQ